MIFTICTFLYFLHIRNPGIKLLIFVFHFRYQKCPKISFLSNQMYRTDSVSLMWWYCSKIYYMANSDINKWHFDLKWIKLTNIFLKNVLWPDKWVWQDSIHSFFHTCVVVSDHVELLWTLKTCWHRFVLPKCYFFIHIDRFKNI